MKLSRTWAMPNKNTFDIPPIGRFVRSRLELSKCSIDPFSRDKQWATYTNDLNPNTLAMHHIDATDFLNKMADEGIVADLVIIDPPYSPRQVKECYDSIGHKMKQGDALLGEVRKKLKAAIVRTLSPAGCVLTFGWNTVGMGKTLGFRIDEILLVCHGSDHNDTICLAETALTQDSAEAKGHN